MDSGNKEEASNLNDSATWREAPFLALKGFLMGSADIIPGVSGGTMALIVGIYDRLIRAISSFDLQFFKSFFTLRWKSAFNHAHWRFLLFLVSGIACAAFFFTRIIPLQTYMVTNPELVFGLFFGLIIGSIYILIKAMDGFTWQHGLFLIAGIFIGLWIVTRVPADTSKSPFFIFLSGAIAICAMVLPGISGSYMLLILRKYNFILSQLGKLGSDQTFQSLWILLPFILGAMVGLLVFTRLLKWLLERYHARTLAVLIGFLIGSLYVIWPYQHRTYATFVSDTKVVNYNSKTANNLRAERADGNQPEYERLGKVITKNGQKRIQVETVKQKLVASAPFIPFVTVNQAGTDSFWQGIIGIGIGLALVGGLDWLRDDAVSS